MGENEKASAGEGKPKRIPLRPVPNNSWKIKRLPEDLKAELDRLLSENTFHSCRSLATWLSENGFQISHAAIHKYGQKFDQRLDSIRKATEQAKIVCAQFKDDDQQMQTALMRLVQTQLFEVLAAANEKQTRPGARKAALASVNLTALARSVSSLAKAQVENRRWSERARERIALAEKTVDEARAKGLSGDAADQIKSVLMAVWE
ncbi:MAG: hypothetical protein JWM69_885 [Candidatus Binatus sp.]|jgi:hypothetical protein|nr:hypothetical protein [Candidatus Binatus sp.]